MKDAFNSIIFLVFGCSTCGIACCVTHFDSRNEWQQHAPVSSKRTSASLAVKGNPFSKQAFINVGIAIDKKLSSF